MLADAQEVDVDREVANGVELHVAWDHPRLGAIEIEHEDGALEVAGMQLLRDRPVVHVDGLRRPVLSPYRMPGMRPSRRAARAPPLPVRGRVQALSSNASAMNCLQ